MQPLFPEFNPDETPSRSNSPSVSEKPLPHHQISTLQRIGWYSLAVLVLGSLVLSFAVGFLIFLWWGHQNRSNTAWRWLVLEGWISVTITLAALCIQLTVSAQAAVAISMLASWTLEQWGTPIGQSVAIATMRFVNTGPLASLAVFCQNLKTLGGSSVFLLAALLASTTVLSQFSSTLLFSDVPLGTIPGYSRMSDVNIAWGNINSTVGLYEINRNDFNQISPLTYPSFAEYKNTSTVVDGLSDTGTTLRGFLPFTSEADRISLQQYQGPMTVADFRVACVKPHFLEASLSSKTFSGVAIPSRDDLPILPVWYKTNFNCSLAGPDDAYTQMICITNGGQGANGLSDWPTEYFNLTNGSAGSARLFLNFKGLSFYNGYINFTANNSEIPGWSTSSSGPWFNLEVKKWGNDYQDVCTDEYCPQSDDYAWYGTECGFPCAQPVFNVSICYNTVGSTYEMDITASSKLNRTEPTLVWDPSASRYNTHDVARQLGVFKDQYSPKDQEILSIDINSVKAQVEGWLNSDRTAFEHRQDGPRLDEGINPEWSYHFGSWQICTQCEVYGTYIDIGTDIDLGYTTLNLRHATLIQDILDSTSNPSLALQAHLTSLYRMVYYEFHSYFTEKRSILTASFEARSFPQHFRGIIIILITISVHFTLVAIITVLFCTGTRYSLLDNAWATISQLATSTTEDIFRVSTLAKDYDVQKMLSRSTTSPRLARIGPVAGSGRIGLLG